MDITKISRFAIEMYLSCQRCFYYSYRHKIKNSSFPFTLNNAVDHLCKKEFDFFRIKEEPHPLFIEHGIDAIPFKHSKIDDWRNPFKGAYYLDKKNGFQFGGVVDDIWKKNSGQLVIADFKATSKNYFDWEETYYKYDYPKAYKRQIEMYQYVFRKLGFDVADEGYLLYFNGKKNEPRFNNELKFEAHLIKLDCSDYWVEDVIKKAIDCLNQDQLPHSSENCDTCNYIKQRVSVCQNDVREFLDKCTNQTLKKGK